MSTEQLTEAVRAVLDAARTWRAAVADELERGGAMPLPEEAALAETVDTLDALLARVRMATEERVPARRLLAGDEIQLSDGAWVPVLERWTRRNGIEVCVELPPADSSDPDSAPTRRTWLLGPGREVTRRPAEDSATVDRLTEALGAIVITSGEHAWRP